MCVSQPVPVRFTLTDIRLQLLLVFTPPEAEDPVELPDPQTTGNIFTPHNHFFVFCLKHLVTYMYLINA
jgi:hypothetical protein